MKILPVNPFFQNDNEYWGNASGYVQCCPTSNAMLVAYLQPDLLVQSKAAGFAEFESFYKSEFEKAGYSSDDRGNHDAHTVCLEERFQIESSWYTDLKPEDLKASIDAGIPVVVGVEYKEFGHIFLVIGYSDEGWFVHDPFGIRSGASDEYKVINDGSTSHGASDFYSHRTAQVTIFSGGFAWGRIVHRNKGVVTQFK